MSAFSSTLTVNSLFWFTSLGPTQQGLTRRILEDLMPYLDSIGLSHQTYGPQTADQLRGMLNEIARKAAAGLRPVLHFDTHGNATHGIKLDASGEFVSWPDLVVTLRAINVATTITSVLFQEPASASRPLGRSRYPTPARFSS